MRITRSTALALVGAGLAIAQSGRVSAQTATVRIAYSPTDSSMEPYVASYLRRVHMPPIAANARPPARELLSENLIFERARAGLSQTGLADAAGLSRQTISEIERAATNPSLDVIDRIVAALNISIDRLFVLHRSGLVDDDELARRRASGREDTVDALEALDAIEEAAGRPRRFSNAGRPRLGR